MGKGNEEDSGWIGVRVRVTNGVRVRARVSIRVLVVHLPSHHTAPHTGNFFAIAPTHVLNAFGCY